MQHIDAALPLQRHIGEQQRRPESSEASWFTRLRAVVQIVQIADERVGIGAVGILPFSRVLE